MQNAREQRMAKDAEPIDCIELSRQFVTRFHRHHFDWCLDMCARDITFVSSSPAGFAAGSEAFDSAMRTVYGDVPPGLVGSFDATATAVPNSQATLVACRFLLATDPMSGEMRARQEHGTLLWDTTDGRPVLLHLHFSTPARPAAEGLDAPTYRETYLYAKAVLDQVIRRSALTLRDTSGTLHYVSATEVRFVEASRQRTLIHCLERTIVVRRGFRELIESFEGELVPVHRSFAVSPLYVRAIGPGTVLLDDGTEIPVPHRRSREVCERLQQAVDRIEGMKRTRDTSRPVLPTS